MQETQISQIECLSDCFAQMGQDTREFVINTIKVQMQNLVQIGDVEHYKAVIDELIKILDGNQDQEGFDKFIKLVNDVQVLMKRMDQTISINEVKNLIQQISPKLDIDDLIKDEKFIKKLSKNNTIFNAFIVRISRIINQSLDETTDGSTDEGSRFISVFNRLIDRRIKALKVQINKFKTEIDKDVNKLNERISKLTTEIRLCTTKEEFVKLETEVKECCSSYSTLENRLEELDNKWEGIDRTIISIKTTISELEKDIEEIRQEISQFVSKDELAQACKIACDAFRNALKPQDIPSII
jgi:methyl-accepting chemotaxis protein